VEKSSWQTHAKGQEEVDYTQRAGVQEKGERAFEWCGGWFGWAVQYLAPKLLPLTGLAGRREMEAGRILVIRRRGAHQGAMLCECNHPIIPLNYNFIMSFSHKGFKYAIVEPLQYVRGLPQSFTAERRSLSGQPADSIDTRVLRRPGQRDHCYGSTHK